MTNYSSKVKIRLFAYKVPIGLLLTVVFFAFSLTVNAETVQAGSSIPYTAYLKNTGSCDIYVTKVTKSWSSTGNVIQSVNLRSTVSNSQTGSKSTILNNFRLPPNQFIAVAYNFQTVSGKSGTITITSTFDHDSNCDYAPKSLTDIIYIES